MRVIVAMLMAIVVLAACSSEDAVVSSDNEGVNVREVVDPIDAAPEDTGAVDTAPEDTGAVDTAPEDTGAVDTAPEDTGAVDTAPANTSTVAHRSEPRPINSGFHNDPVELVGNTGNPQLLEFYTTWCPTCRQAAPIVHGLEADYWGDVDFIYLDREEAVNKDVVDLFGIRYQPVFILLDAEGNFVEQWFGAVNEASLRDALDAISGA